jgi:hypothetical protein
MPTDGSIIATVIAPVARLAHQPTPGRLPTSPKITYLSKALPSGWASTFRPPTKPVHVNQYFISQGSHPLAFAASSECVCVCVRVWKTFH